MSEAAACWEGCTSFQLAPTSREIFLAFQPCLKVSGFTEGPSSPHPLRHTPFCRPGVFMMLPRGAVCQSPLCCLLTSTQTLWVLPAFGSPRPWEWPAISSYGWAPQASGPRPSLLGKNSGWPPHAPWARGSTRPHGWALFLPDLTSTLLNSRGLDYVMEVVVGGAGTENAHCRFSFCYMKCNNI